MSSSHGEQAKKDGHALFTFPTTGYFDATIYAMLAQAGGLDFYNDALKYDANTWTSDEGKKVLDTVAKLVGKDYTQEDTVSNANADGWIQDQSAERNRWKSIIYAKRKLGNR